MSQHRLLDLGIDDVHQPGAVGVAGVKPKADPSKPSMEAMGELKAKKRNSLPNSAFADPQNRAYPVHDKAHADNAAARLEQQKGSLSPSKYASIKRRIKAAQRRHGEKPKGMRFRSGYGFQLSIDHPKKGRIEIRQLGDVHLPGQALVAMADKDDTSPKWNQLAIQGRFFKDGSFFEMTEQTFRDIVRNFDATRNHEVPLDFEHASEMPGSAGQIAMVGAPAQGWIKAVELRQDGNLYGLIDFNELARAYVATKQYKYLSPAVRFGCKDARTGLPIGARLTSAALTNTPFLDGMQPVAAKDQPMPDPINVTANGFAASNMTTSNVNQADVLMKGGSMCYSSAEYMPQLRAALGLSSLATGKMCKDALGMLREHLGAAGGDASAAPMGVRLGDYLSPLRDMVRPPFGATYDDMLDAVEELIEHAIEEHNITEHGMSPGEAEMTDQPPASAVGMTDTPNEEAPDMTTANTNVPATAAPAAAPAPAQTAGGEALAVMLKDSETARMQLNAEVKEANAKLADATAKLAQLEAEVVKMKDESAKAAEAAVEAEVDAVIMAYKDTKGVKPEDKGELVAFLKSAPKLFRAQYPAVAPAQAHLLRDITTQPTGPKGRELPAEVQVPDLFTLADKYMREDKLSNEEATTKAFIEVSRRTAALQH